MSSHHESEPEHYQSPLSQEASQHRANLEAKLASVYEKANAETNSVLRVKIIREADRIEASLDLQGANPKKVPFAQLKEHVQSASDDDPIVNKYRARIKNRATGIRAYCMTCMGGEAVSIRLCASLTCPLHPFRMGGDPFRGYELPKPVEVEIEDEDDTEDFEEGDDGSDADATA